MKYGDQCSPIDEDISIATILRPTLSFLAAFGMTQNRSRQSLVVVIDDGKHFEVYRSLTPKTPFQITGYGVLTG